jgi:hypothetical protein
MRRLAAAVGLFALTCAAACKPSEGDRCNPLLFSDECGSGLACTYPAGCGVAYCCPPSTTNAPATCQPCATDDGGVDGSTD